MTYPAPGSPELAGDVQALLTAVGVQVTFTATRGLDHGAWVPLVLMYPEADVPVVQLSLEPRRGAAYHVELGRHLAPRRDQGVLIIGSGGVTHNLRELEWGGTDIAVPAWAASFNEWVADATADERIDDLISYREQVHQSYTMGALSMDVYQFGGHS